jgi:rare lipoprotein A
VRVRNEHNGREVIVRINDRGPRIPDRIIDLSKAAADALGFLKAGEASVVLAQP